MVIVKVKGREIEVPVFVGAFDRRAVMIENKIMVTLKMFNIDRDNVDSELS